MILHTIVDPTEIMMRPQNDNIHYKRIGGCLCACQERNGECRVDRIISTCLDDYLNPRFTPGTVLPIGKNAT